MVDDASESFGAGPGGFCPDCGSPVVAFQRFCSNCGHQVTAPPRPGPASLPAAGSAPITGPATDGDYPQVNKVIAAVLTIFAPIICLIVALVLRSGEQHPVRRNTLKVWAIAAGVWFGLGLVIVLAVAAAAFHSVADPSTKGPCLGGPQMGATGTPLGHGRYRFPCADGGSTVVNLGQ